MRFHLCSIQLHIMYQYKLSQCVEVSQEGLQVSVHTARSIAVQLCKNTQRSD